MMSSPLLITFIVYIAGMLFIGFMAWRSTKNFDDYILGGRSLGSLVTALSAGASDMSGWLLMGLPGAVFFAGISESWIAIGLIIGAWLNWVIVAGRLRLHTEIHANALTLPDFFTHRFEDKSRLLRLISALIILVFFTIYCASGIVAGARLFESAFNLDYATAMWAGAAATIVYTFIGGFLAVSWTDTIQASLMIFALVLMPIFIIYALGGLPKAIVLIQNAAPEKLDILHNMTAIGIISMLGWGLGYFGQPHILARFMAADSHRSMPAARKIAMCWMILCLLGAVGTGFFGIAWFLKHPDLAGPVLANPERVFMALTGILFNPWIAGILLSAILAAVMSTLSCQLLVCSSALTEDLYKGFLRKNAGQKERVWVGRMMVLAVAVVAIMLARDPENRVLGLVSYAWAGFGAAFGPVILFSLCWGRMNRNGALAGMIVGTLTVIIWKQLAFSDLYEIIPGFMAASLAIVVFSFTGAKPNNAILQRLINAKKAYKN